MLRRVLIVLIVSACAGCAGSRGRATVVWISIDGFRHDYADRTDTPLLHRFMREGAYSRKLETITPTLTFPSHVSQATGVPAGLHGIVSNDMYDGVTKQQYNFPNDPALLQSEPIWITAKRQGVRTLVHDWPLSYGRFNGIVPDHAHEKFDAKPTDEQRLNAILSTWQNDRNKQPLRLLMGYIKRPDSDGHRLGPDAPQMKETIRHADALLANFVDRSVELFNRTRRDGDELYIIVTTDHGMMNVHTLVNEEKLFSSPLPKNVRIATSGPLGLVHLDQVPESQRDALMKNMLRDLRRHDFLTAYTKTTLPKRWGLDHPTRVGEITLMLKPGYFFSLKFPHTTHPLAAGDVRGMHGYPLEDVPDMRGFFAIWRYPTPLNGRDLEKVNALQLHPTVAKLLDVKPAPRARSRPLPIK